MNRRQSGISGGQPWLWGHSRILAVFKRKTEPKNGRCLLVSIPVTVLILLSDISSVSMYIQTDFLVL